MKNIGHLTSYTSLGHNGCPVKKALVCGIRQHWVVTLFIKSWLWQSLFGKVLWIEINKKSSALFFQIEAVNTVEIAKDFESKNVNIIIQNRLKDTDKFKFEEVVVFSVKFATNLA